MATQYYTASSIDGFIADPDNSLTWLFQFSEQTGMEDHYPKFIAQVGAMAMGSTTYEWVADHTGFLMIPASGSTPSRPGCSAAASCHGSKAPTSGSFRGTWRRSTRRWCGWPMAVTSGW